MGKFKDGHEKVGGRKVGSKNKTPANIAKIVLECFDKIGGVPAMADHFTQTRNRTAFYTKMLAPLLPRSVSLSVEEHALKLAEQIKEKDPKLYEQMVKIMNEEDE